MTDDKLLKAVAEAARAQDVASDARWSARVQGTLSKDEEEALEELARQSEAHREAWEASRPLGSEARSRIADRLLAEMQAPKAAASTKASARPAKRRGASVFLAASALLAAAVLLLFFVRAPRRPLGSELEAQGQSASVPLPVPVPTYSMRLLGGDLNPGDNPDDPGVVVRLSPGSKLDITLVPATHVEGPIAVRGFLIHGRVVLRWDVEAKVSEQGAAHIKGDTEALFNGVPGARWRIALAVGRSEALPSDEEVVLRALDLDEVPATWGFRLLWREVLLEGHRTRVMIAPAAISASPGPSSPPNGPRPPRGAPSSAPSRDSLPNARTTAPPPVSPSARPSVAPTAAPDGSNKGLRPPRLPNRP